MVFPEKTKTVSALAPIATNGNPASVRVDVSQAQRVRIVCLVTKGNAALTSFAIEQANTAGGGGNKPLANAIPIWSNLACATSETLVRRTNAVSYALDNNAAAVQLVVFDLDPAKLDTNAGFRWIRVQTGAGDAANLASITFHLDLRQS